MLTVGKKVFNNSLHKIGVHVRFPVNVCVL